MKKCPENELHSPLLQIQGCCTMVVVCCGILQKTGSVIFSRNFLAMESQVTQSWFSAFPSLSQQSEHSVFETEEVRYCCHQIQPFYLVMVTTRTSNIIQDLECMRTMVRIVQDQVQMAALSITEKALKQCQFDIMAGWDEEISSGYPNNLTVDEIDKNIAMISYEEEHYKRMQKEREKNAKKALQRKMSEFSEQNQGRIGGHVGQMSISHVPHSRPDTYGAAASRMGAGPSRELGHSSASASRAAAPVRPQVRGLKLRRAEKPRENLVEELKHEVSNPDSTAATAPQAPAPVGEPAPDLPVVIVANENLHCTLHPNGRVASMKVVGEIKLTVRDPAATHLTVRTRRGVNTGVTFQKHPNLHADDWRSQGIMRNAKPFPLHSAVPVVRWDTESGVSRDVPLVVSVWVENDGHLTIEYELKEDIPLTDVAIMIHCAGVDARGPDVKLTAGSYRFDSDSETLFWQHDLIDASNASGTLEITVPQSALEELYPIPFAFNSERMLCDIDIEGVSTESGESVPFAFIRRMAAEKCMVDTE
eukprot:gnl/Trimastix_PCT/860.p1 GENE.gnl/Trimastix_PCT/860~~gnl/Trimastix_PCT/860.p1  ORF type:complete len:569 (+),score=96.27 gnl/Trimastix_PCT/860:108-1709(+)